MFGNKKIKCCFCNNYRGMLTSVSRNSNTNWKLKDRLFFHNECLERIEVNPEGYSPEVIDLAVEAIEGVTYSKVINKRLVKDIENKLNLLKQNSLERMMPKR